MKKPIAILALIAIVFFTWFFYTNSLTCKIKNAIKDKDCIVSVALINGDKYRTIGDSGKKPLMSVFKYFIAVSVLKKLEDENLSLDDKILINDLIKTTYSPMAKKYTKFPFEIPVADLMKYMISESDNNAADILLEYSGGTFALQEFLNKSGFSGIKISADEKLMEADIQNQYLNVASPLDVISFIKLVRESSILSENSKKFLDKIMIETVTGENKIKAGLPKNVILGHKTGMSSRKPDGTRIAENDVGFVILPNGKTYYIAVFVTESKMTDTENTALIAQISKIIFQKTVK